MSLTSEWHENVGSDARMVRGLSNERYLSYCWHRTEMRVEGLTLEMSRALARSHPSLIVRAAAGDHAKELAKFPGIQPPPGEEVRPSDSGHTAFYKHDTARTLTHKAIGLARTAHGRDDAERARNQLFEAARSHRAAAQEFGAFSTRLDKPGTKGRSDLASRVAQKHRKVADLAEKLAANIGVHATHQRYLGVADAIGAADVAADRLSAALP
jgi:hypothetical protein